MQLYCYIHCATYYSWGLINYKRSLCDFRMRPDFLGYSMPFEFPLTLLKLVQSRRKSSPRNSLANLRIHKGVSQRFTQNLWQESSKDLVRNVVGILQLDDRANQSKDDLFSEIPRMMNIWLFPWFLSYPTSYSWRNNISFSLCIVNCCQTWIRSAYKIVSSYFKTFW